MAYLTGRAGADLGVMLSASHNPMPDNGIKLFAAGGHKLPDEVEDAIEAGDRRTDAGHRPDRRRRRPGPRPAATPPSDYVDHLLGARAAPAGRAAGRRRLRARRRRPRSRPRSYRRAGAEVIAIGAEPRRLNINDGVGSTHLEPLVEAVAASTAPTSGIAHDGDADRCLAVDADGDVVDGDQILAICALALHERGHAAPTTPSSPP